METPIRVLLVDGGQGESDVAKRLERERDTFDVRRVDTASAGLERFADTQFDCLVTAYDLPDSDGIELLRNVREDGSDVPVILFAERGNEAIASETFAAGGSGYLRRDAGYATLADCIDDVVTTHRHSQEYRTLVTASPVPILVVDGTLTVRYANPSAGDVIGNGDPDSLVGEDARTFVPEDIRDSSIARLQRVFEAREPADVREYRYLTLDGESRFGRGTITPVTFEGTAAAQVVVEDVTDRKQRERRLKRQRRQVASLHDVGVDLASCQSRDAVYELVVEAGEDILDLDLCIVGVVENGHLTLGASSREMSEDGYIEPPVDSDEAGLSGKSYRRQESYLVDDLANFPDANPVQEYHSAIVAPIGEYGAFQAVAHETDAFTEMELELVEIIASHAREALTRLEQEQELREQRDQLTRENERLEEFASIVSHDLRNPLNVVQGRLDQFQREHGTEDEHITAALRSASRMETLISDLLTLARHGNTVSEYESISLETIARECWRNVETDGATLTVDTDFVIRADSNRTQELLANLIRNAIEHGSAESGTDTGLTITVGELTDADGFYVEDDGSGIEIDDHEKLFDFGFSTSVDGTGFGLAIVKQIAHAHGWQVDVTEGEMGGARFEISGVESGFE